MRKLIIGLALSAALIVPSTASAGTASWKPCGTLGDGSEVQKIAQAGKRHMSCKLARKVARKAKHDGNGRVRVNGRLWKVGDVSLNEWSYYSGPHAVHFRAFCWDGYLDEYGDCVVG